MDRKQLLGFGLILILLGIWLYLNQPTEAERLEIERRRDSLNRIENQERTPISTDTSMEDLTSEESRADSTAISAALTERYGIFAPAAARSEEHTSELQSRGHLVCRFVV